MSAAPIEKIRYYEIIGPERDEAVDADPNSPHQFRDLNEFPRELKHTLSAVCQIIGPNHNGHHVAGTGFFCKLPVSGRDVIGLATCHHVLDSDTPDRIQNYTVYFSKGGEHMRLTPDTLGPFRRTYPDQNVDIDVTFLELSSDTVAQLRNRQIHFLQHGDPVNEERIYVVGYPVSNISGQAATKLFSIGNFMFDFNSPPVNSILNLYTTGRIHLSYQAGTLPGSSGSPVLNSKGQIIGIHQAGYNDYIGRARNKALNIDVLIAKLCGDQIGNACQPAAPCVETSSKRGI